MAWKAHVDYVMKCKVQRWRRDLGRLLLVKTSWPDKYSRLDVSTKIRISGQISFFLNGKWGSHFSGF